MKFKNLINENLILLNCDLIEKKDIIEALVEQMDQEGALLSKADFLGAVMEREAISPTGLEEGLAIPHGKSKSVKKATLAVARLNTPISSWESVDEDNMVDLVFLIAIPEAEKGSTHIEVLTKLTTSFMKEGFLDKLKKSKTKKELLEVIYHVENEDKSEFTNSTGKTIVAITACATGIAHTYMAAEALEKAGRELGITVLTEKQGANGIEDKHTKEQIKNADAVIFATDIAAKDIDRYNGKNYVKVRVAEPLKNAKGIIEKALNNPEGIVNVEKDSEYSEENRGICQEMMQGIMTGLSYMIPVIVAGGLMMGIAKLGAIPFGIVQTLGAAENAVNPNKIISLLHHMDKFGGLIYKFMYPIFSAYLAFSIAGKTALVSGLVGGAFAGGLHHTFWNMKGQVPSGFFGAIILGIIAGYVSKIANDKIKVTKNLNAMKPMLIIPAISSIAILIANLYFVDPVFGALNKMLMEVIKATDASGAVLLSSIIAACTAFDLGGPINKAAGAIAIGLAADKIFPLTPRVLAIVIPPIGLGLATVIDKHIVGRRVFSDDLKVVGETSILLGFIAISEGAIPFMIQNPFITIPLNIIGAVLGAVTAVSLGAVQWLPLPAIWGWPLVTNFTAYFTGLTVGALFIAISNIFVRFYLIKREEKKGV
ncbi:MAG: fructose-specific PTS transporter subunit EIIC [Fusobacteriaceae bacterium]